MNKMRAVVLDAPGPASNLQIRDVARPEPRPGWVLLRVESFGLNRSELHTRLGLADSDVTFPRVLGIEATGVIEAAPQTGLTVGSKAVAMVGGMDEIVRAHEDMEHNRVAAKQVVLTHATHEVRKASTDP